MNEKKKSKHLWILMLILAMAMMLGMSLTAYAATVPTGALGVKFTINADGGKVNFSQGNLQATYDGSAWTWAFAANQWDYIGGQNPAGIGTQTGNNYINGNVSCHRITGKLVAFLS